MWATKVTALSQSFFSLLQQVDAKVPDTGPDSTFLLYGGRLSNGTFVSFAVESFDELGIHHVVQADVGKFALSVDFRRALKAAVATDYFPGAYLPLLTAKERKILSGKLSAYYNGSDLEGKRINFESVWDIASRKYVEENDGKWRIAAGSEVDPKSILVKTEIPALLEKSGDFTINGQSKDLIVGIGTPAQAASHVLAMAAVQTHASQLSPGSVAEFLGSQRRSSGPRWRRSTSRVRRARSSLAG